jgi:hypothetical protein
MGLKELPARGSLTTWKKLLRRDWEIALTRVRATRLPYAFAVLSTVVMSGCGGGSSSGNPGPVGASVTVSPVTASVQVGLTQMVTATVANDSANKGVTWALSGAGCSAATCGTLSPSNSASGTAITYTAPAAVPSPANVTLTATSVADGTKTAAATITVTAAALGIAVTLSKPMASLQVGTSTTFSATVANDSGNKGVSWTLSGPGCSGATCGTVTPTTSASGVAVTYVAPASVPTPPTVLLTATSVADGTKSAAATITITAATSTAITVTLSQPTASVVTSGTQVFTATVANDSANQGVTWALSGTGCTGATCGTVAPTASASGTAVTYTAPVSVPVPPTVTLTATSVTDTTKTAAATITVTVSARISVTLTPKRGGLALGQSLNFTATVTNDVDAAGVAWSASTGSGSFSAETATTATYGASNSPGSITVTATSVADGTQSATATIGVTDLAGVTTYHNDLSRDGANVQEYALKTSNVATATFGKLFSCPVVGAVYAQPLWVPNVTIGNGGGTHNVIVVATQRDWVYVFDADASPCTTYWSTQFIPSGETYVNYNDFTTGGVSTEDIYQDIGITGTPVIDPSTNTIYLVTKTKNSGTLTAHSRLHAVSLATGAEATNSPVEISASVAGNCDGGSSVAFNPLMQNQRPGLALLNGAVYVGWGSHGDVGNWHGWLMGFQTANLAAAPSVFLSTPNGLASPVSGAPACAGGIWMSGGAPAIDASNNLYALTGNGAFDGTSDFGDSYMKLGTPSLSISDWFTPSNQVSLDQNDTDVGSSGTAVLVDQTSGTNPHLLVGASKGQVFFVLNRDNMGHYTSGGPDAVVQEFGLDGHSFSTPGFWNNNAYFFGVVFGSTLAGETFSFDTGSRTFNSTATHHTPSTFGFPGATPSISASSATTDGIVWAINTASYGTSDSGSRAAGAAVLHAFDASNVSTELWNSSQASGGRDTAGFAVKFTVPTVANGYAGERRYAGEWIDDWRARRLRVTAELRRIRET